MNFRRRPQTRFSEGMKIFPIFPDKFIKKGVYKTKAKSCRCQAFTLPNRVLDQLDWE